MDKYIKKFKLLVLQAVILGVSSCVGTIDEAKKLDQTTVESSTSEIVFSGPLFSKVISHQKIEAYFKPASGGSGKGFVYRIYINGASTPAATLVGATATTNSEGYLYKTISGLTKSTTYAITAKAYDLGQMAEDTNSAVIYATTLENPVPVFEGVLALNPLDGSAGETTLHAKWSEALAGDSATDPLDGTDPYAIGGYRVYLGNSDSNLILNTSLTGSTVTSYDIKGLAPGTKYCVRVRSFSQGSENVASAEETNSKVLCAKTNTSAPIAFSGLTTAKAPLTSSGFYQINLTWSPASGSFDRYTILLSTNPTHLLGFTPAEISTYKFQDIILSDANTNPTNVTLNGLTPYTNYYVAMIACNDANCSSFSSNGLTNVKSVYTIPTVAEFDSNFIPILSSPDTDEADSSLYLDYEFPNKNEGYYDDSNGLRIYQTDMAGNISESNRLYEYDGTGPGWTIEPSTTTQTQIKGLSNGQTYYFIIKSVLTDPRKSSGYQYSSNLNVASARVGRVIPDFTGIASCVSESPTTVKVKWNLPSKGTFNYFEVFALDATSASVTTGENFFKQAYTQVDSGITDLAEYDYTQAAKTASAVTVTDLIPATTYKIGVKTYFYSSSTAKSERDGNTVIINCTTQTPSVSFQGWFDLYSIGPKIDGTDISGRVPLREKIAPDGYDAYGKLSSADTDALIDTIYTNRYAKECSTDLDACESNNSSVQGIVRLTWDDFVIDKTDNKTIYDYYYFQGATDLGYRVYRMDYDEGLHATLPPSISDSGWKLISGESLIIPKAKNISKTSLAGNPTLTDLKKIGEWVDYTLDRSSTEINTTRIFWYKIEAMMNGKRMPYTFESDNSLKVGDEIIRVVLPPDNQAFAHRWIMNRQMCSLILKDFDRANNYRCLFNGLGSTKDPLDGNYYYDIHRHLIADRFEGSCNFSRGACSSTNGNLVGAPDCVGKGSPTTLSVNAADGSVYLNIASNEQMCYYKTASGWKEINSGFSCNTLSSSSCSLPPYSSDYPSGQGIGNIMRSNSARLRPFTVSAFVHNHLCHSFSINHRSSSVTGRLGRRKEMIPLIFYSPYLTVRDAQKLADGSLYDTASNKKRACNGRMYSQLGIFSYPTYLNYNNWPIYTSTYDYLSAGAGITGSRIDSYNNTSTEACESRFGLNDAYGSFKEMTADVISFNAKDVYGANLFLNYGAVSSPSSLTTLSVIDPLAREDWKNGNEIYYSVSTEDNTYSTLDTTPTTYSSSTGGVIVTRVISSSYPYFNPMMGVTFDCGSLACLDNATDDMRISPRSNIDSSTIKSFPYRLTMSFGGNTGSLKGLMTLPLGGAWFANNGIYDHTEASFYGTQDYSYNGGNPRCIYTIDEGADL